jgi:hypothetical protein
MSKKSEPLVESLHYRLSSRFPFTLSRRDTSGSVPTSYNLGHIHRLYDAFVCMKASNMDLPKGVSNVVLEDLHEVTVNQFWDFFASGKEAARLSIGRFLGDISETIRNRVEGKKGSHKLAIFSGHDT